jgi:hypothetical protein
VVTELATGTKVHGLKPSVVEDDGFFKGNKNPEHNFLQRP